MSASRDKFSRRTFLKGLRFAPSLLVPAPIRPLRRWPSIATARAFTSSNFRFDLRVSPHYPAKTPLEEIVGQVLPGRDQYITEKYALEIMSVLEGWSKDLKVSPIAFNRLLKSIDGSVAFADLTGGTDVMLRDDYGISVLRRRFQGLERSGRDNFLDQLNRYLFEFSQLDTAAFEITGISMATQSPLSVNAEVRYEIVGARKNGGREQRIGKWQTGWSQSANGWQLSKLHATDESVGRSREPIFADVTLAALGPLQSYKTQLLRGTDHWRTVLDGACGIDVYGNNGVAIGDFDGDGWDDIYICQPAGLPNRLYRNCGDGTFEEVTEPAGVDVLDATSCALFADFENKGLKDLLVICEGGPLLFVNQGKRRFDLKRDAFKFSNPPQGTFTHAAAADYDGDGRPDIYFCLYNYYLGLEQYHYPVPYFDARNGPPNFLLHNEGNARFEDSTEAAGLNVDNDRYSFACGWGDYQGNGWPDLYVSNDFGRSNLYRNNGDGTFTSVSAEAGAEDPGAGMSTCWFDFDGDGNQDVYVGNMWSAAGMRVSNQKIFHPDDPENIRGLYRRHARGNSLYRNKGGGQFENVAEKAGVEMGRWAWSCDSWDFDHDGFADLYIANGYISGSDSPDLASFFWRQLVAESPENASPSPKYERGWNAINELIRSDGTWNGYERNVVYVNNRDGTFSDISGVSGLDCVEDGRAFALADLDHDGRLEVVLKSRNAPQLRILRSVSSELGNSVSFRLRGVKSNRDAVGAAVTVETGGRRQTKYLQAGSGFLSQHSQEVFFGVGKAEGTLRAIVRWPSHQTQTFEQIPINRRIEIQEGSSDFTARAFERSRWSKREEPLIKEVLPANFETWLVQPLAAPDFSLPDRSGTVWRLRSFEREFVLLSFFSPSSDASRQQLNSLRRAYASFTSSGLHVLAIEMSVEGDPSVASPAAHQEFPFPVLTATEEMIGVYNITYRYLFDRHKDLPLPSSFLISDDGQIVKVYQGTTHPDRFLADAKSIPRTVEERMQAALPFSGKLFLGEFERNDFTYGVAFFQRGYLDQAAESFKQVIARKPSDAEAYYNLGTLYLRREDREQARKYLEQTVQLQPNYPEAWNNLGMLAAQEGDNEGAVTNFKKSLALRPDYVITLVNLGNLYRRQRATGEAERLLRRALALEPNDPEVNYSIAMLYAQQGDVPNAEQHLQKAVALRPDYADALNNLGVLLVREQRYSEAEDRFKSCIEAVPNFDQAYLNLARLYMMLDRKQNAREVLQALLRQQPRNKMAQQALEMLH
jgi:Flp pilus assembly protein TadD/peroxiredoxin